MDEQIKISFKQLLPDYPIITKGLAKMGIDHPTDLQEQVLSINQQIENLIITAPEGCGRKLVLILLALKRFSNEEEGALVFVTHSKQLSKQVASIVAVLSRTPVINLSMEEWRSNVKKCIVIGTPIKLSQLTKQKKDTFLILSIFEWDLLLAYDYGASLDQLASSISPNAIYQLCAIKVGTELDAFKAKTMKKVTKIDYKSPEEANNHKVEKVQGQAVHIYQVGQSVMIPITLYVTLKFGLVNPKVLILVKDLKEVYRYTLFLERAKIQGVALYNHENPINLKFYGLQVWMNGPTNILISTPAIYKDINSNIFKQNCKKNYKKDNFALVNLATVICINVKHMKSSMQDIMSNFTHKPFLMTILENTEEEINTLQEIIKMENQMFEAAKAKEYPISKKQLQAFRYRIHDVFMNLGNHKVQMFQKYDFKKKMLKSSDLKEYFVENPKQKEVLIKEVTDLKKKINYEAIIISDIVPLYLVPDSLKRNYEEQLKSVQKQMKTEEVPSYIKKARDALRHVDLDEQDPEVTDVSRLKLVSSRKRWKLQHGFKLIKKNKRLEKKGIFTTS